MLRPLLRRHTKADVARCVPTKMNTSSTRSTHKRLILLGVLAFVVVALDQISKAWIRANLVVGDEIVVVPNVVHLSHVLNRGAAWSLLSGQRWLLIVITIVVIGAILSASRSLVERGVLGAWSVGLISGGALGNLVDRIFHGQVTDMIDMDTSWNVVRNFPVFNLADSALTLGVCLLGFHLMRGEKSAAKTDVVVDNLSRIEPEA